MLNNTKNVRPSKAVRSHAILKAAKAAFEEHGYAKTKVSKIAAQIGVSEGTIFHHFGSKQGLVIKVMEQFYGQITEGLRLGLNGIKGTRNRLYFIVCYHLKMFIENAAICSVIIGESRRGMRSELSVDIRRFNRDYTSFLYELIKAGIANGEFRADTSNFLVRNMVYGSIEHIMWTFIAEGKQVDIEKTAEELTDLVFRGISIKTEHLEKGEISSLVKKLNRLMKEID